MLILLATILNNTAYGNIQVYIGKGFDRITSSDWDMQDILVLALVILGSGLVQGVTSLVRSLGSELLAQRLERDCRREFYVSLLGKSQSFHGKQAIGDIMARATNDVRSINLMFSPGIMLIVDSVMGLIVPVIMMALIHPLLLVTPSLFTVGLTITVWEYNRRLKPVSIKQREHFGIMNSGLAESINGIEVVKASVGERYELHKFLGNASAFRDYFVKQGIIQARYWPMLVFAFFWGMAFLHGLYLWRLEEVTLGEVVAFMGLFGALRFVTFISIFSFNLVQLGLASAGRILRMIRVESDLDENRAGHTGRISGSVQFENVGFAFDGTSVLKNVSFSVTPGETIAIVGQTGSGKSTMTRLINRIFDATSGRVVVDGVDARDWNMGSLRSQISIIEQDIFLYSTTIRENIAFGRPEADLDAVKQAAENAQAHDFITGFREGYDTEIGERGVTLSGGQKQRLAIARAFLTDPRILILDDSTSAVDSQTEDAIQEAMRRIARERTTFIITHRLSQIRWADRIIVLKRGEVTDLGTHDDLLARSSDYRRVFAHL